MPEPWQIGGFGLYVHWPYCQSKCPYCDFNSHVAQRIDQDDWSRAYASELARHARELPDRVLRSIYFGGGTPSLMEPAVVEKVISAAAKAWRFSNDIEITLEANPGSVEQARFGAYKDAGVNRVSLGVQALEESDLRRLGRVHSVSDALSALDVARAVFGRVSFDLIYARQDQHPDAWEAELRRALSMDPDHLSLYQLTIEDGTAFGALFAKGKLRGLPDEDLSADMYEITQELTTVAGLPAYEISNHARSGQESRHNLIYWNAGDWVGIGPGAHGRLTLDGQRWATETPLGPAAWLRAAQSGSGEAARARISEADASVEYLMMGLRTLGGVDLRRVTGVDREVLSNDINKLVDIGVVSMDADMLTLTPRGRPVLNAVLRDLIPA